ALAEAGLTVDVLVNNAGYVLAGSYVDLDWDDQMRFIRVMATTPAELIRRLLPAMIERRWGRVINVSSVAGVMSGSPTMALYSASKSFVTKLTEGVAVECEPYGVYCTVS